MPSVGSNLIPRNNGRKRAACQTHYSAMPFSAIGSASAAEVGGKIHVFGGRPRDPTPVNDHDIYDPATNEWTKGSPMPMARDHLGIAVIDGKIHIVGGRTGASTQNVHEHDVFDPTTGQDSSKADGTPSSGRNFRGHR